MPPISNPRGFSSNGRAAALHVLDFSFCEKRQGHGFGPRVGQNLGWALLAQLAERGAYIEKKQQPP